MRYTRLDLKKKRRENVIFLSTILLTLILAVIIGTLIFNIFIKNHNISDNKKIQNNAENVTDLKQDNKAQKNVKAFKFCVLQCGVYVKKENAMETISKVTSYGSPFTIEEDKKIKVMMGIYADGKEDEVIKTLSTKGIETSKKNFELKSKELCDVEIGEVISAQIKVINKLYEQDVKSYKSDELKKWTTQLEKVDKSSKNYKMLEEIKSYIGRFPTNISKDKLSDIQKNIYKELNKIK